MGYEIQCVCTDKFSSWKSTPASSFFDNDSDAISWAKRALNYLRKRFSDIEFSEVMLFQYEYDSADERLICALN